MLDELKKIQEKIEDFPANGSADDFRALAERALDIAASYPGSVELTGAIKGLKHTPSYMR